MGNAVGMHIFVVVDFGLDTIVRGAILIVIH